MDFLSLGVFKHSVDVCFSDIVEMFDSLTFEIPSHPESLLFILDDSTWDSMAPNHLQFNSEKSAILLAQFMRGGYLAEWLGFK